MKRRFATISAMLCVVLFSMAFSSCKDEEEEIIPDGDLPILLWVMDDAEFGSVVRVDPVQKSTYPIACIYPENFSKIEIARCKVDDITVYMPYDKDDAADSAKYYASDDVEVILSDPYDYNPLTINGEWFTIDLDGKAMTVSFKPNDTGKERTLYIDPVAKDLGVYAPCYFYFIQAAQEEAQSEDIVE